MIKAIILNHQSKEQNLAAGDLILIRAEGQDSTYLAILDHINPRYGKSDGQPDNSYPYFIKNYDNQLINYGKHEVLKQDIAWFDSNLWHQTGKKILLGHISNDDLNHIIAKKLIENDMGWSERDKITKKDLIGIECNGKIEFKQLIETGYDPIPSASIYKKFKLDRISTNQK